MNHYLKMSLLLLSGFGCIKASDINMFTIQKKYFKPQEVYENYDTYHEYEKFCKEQEEKKKQKEKEEEEEEKKKRSKQQKEKYKPYFKQQEELYQELLEKKIPGARRLKMDEVLAESVLATCPKEVHNAISDIEQGQFDDTEKNLILHGIPGTGKSAIAQAIAIKSQTPCLFFNVGPISTTYMNSGVQNLNKIFEHAQEVEKKLGKPCIIIFDELETLTDKHVGTNNPEKNILRSFWTELDTLDNSKVVAIGTMNSTEDLPAQITSRTSMIKVLLPKRKHRESISSYYLKEKEDKYQLVYPKWFTATFLAWNTKGLSNRDIKKVVARTTRPTIKAPVIPDGSNKRVMDNSFASFIKLYRIINQIKKDPKRKLEREIGTWKHTLKTNLRDPKIIALPLAALTISLAFLYNQIESIALQRTGQTYQKKGLDLQERGLAIQENGQIYQKEGIALQREGIAIQIANQKENIAHQKEAMAQAKKIADFQTSFEHMGRQAKINSVSWKDYSMTWKDNFSNEEICIDSEWLSLNLFGFGLKNKVLKNAK